MNASLLISVLWSFKTGRLMSFLEHRNKREMLFPVGMDEISRAVSSWAELSRRNDGRPVVRFGLLMAGRQGKQSDMNSARCCWHDCSPAGALRDTRDTASMSLCVYFTSLLYREKPKMLYSTWKLHCFWSLPSAIASISQLCVNKASNKKASVKWEQNNAEDKLLLWSRIRGLFL